MTPEDFFKLNSNYSFEDLVKARNQKIFKIENSKLDYEDKSFFIEKINELYKKASFNKLNVFKKLTKPQNKLFTLPTFNNISTSFSQSKNYYSKYLPDGSKVVMEVSETDNNGNKKRITKKYKKLPDGSIKNLSSDQLVKEFSNLYY